MLLKKIRAGVGTLFLLGSLLIYPSFTGSQIPVSNKYHKFIRNIYKQGYFNGNVLIVENGSIAYQGSFGISNINPMDSLQLRSQFRLASVSKQFTAMGIMLLKERGLLDYHQDIQDFIPELPYSQVTVRHLLNHTSGLPDYVILMNEHWKSELAPDNPERFVAGNQTVIDMLVSKAPDIDFKPGEKWQYSNTGYVLLASIIERVTGKPFGIFLREAVFQPAGMTNTLVYNYVPGKDESMPMRVYGYQMIAKSKELIPNDSHFLNPVRGDGGIYSTLGDLYKWDRILYTNQLMAKTVLDEAFTPGTLNNGDKAPYGFGWYIDETPEGSHTVYHAGSWLGFQTHIYREIDQQNCIILLTNHSSIHLGRILMALKNILHQRP